jgi:hypothetical protein
MDRVFIFLGGALVNLHQIAWVGDTGECSLSLHMSDGKTIVVEGKEAVDRLVQTLTDLSMVPDGTPLKDALSLGRKLHVAELHEV